MAESNPNSNGHSMNAPNMSASGLQTMQNAGVPMNMMVPPTAPQMGIAPSNVPMVMSANQQQVPMMGAPQSGTASMAMMNPMQMQMWQLQQQLLQMQRNYTMDPTNRAQVCVHCAYIPCMHYISMCLLLIAGAAKSPRARTCRRERIG